MGSCDICSKSIQEPEGYLLTTKEVVTSEAYWRKSLPMLGMMLPRKALGDNLLMVVARMAKSDTPWMVCENCAVLFSFDLAERREKARICRSTGQPSGGFALCQMRQQGNDIIIDNVDDDGMMAAMRAATNAIRTLESKKKWWQFWK